MREDKNHVIVNDIQIKNIIYTFRDKQVMLDKDLAYLYNVETRVLNQTVKRNLTRFPEHFCFQLTQKEYESLRSQFVISNEDNTRGGRRYTPYVFTEQGIAMLSAVLKSEVAVSVSVKIMDSFVEIRKNLISQKDMLTRLNKIELKQLETEKKIEEVFNYISASTEVKQNIFFAGQIYDAFSFIAGLVEKAKKEIILIDNFVDINTLNVLSKKKQNVNVVVLTAEKTSLTQKDINKFNAQYPNLSIKIIHDFHDRFLIIDKTKVYLIGASIKDAGKKCFAVAELEDMNLIMELIKRVK